MSTGLCSAHRNPDGQWLASVQLGRARTKDILVVGPCSTKARAVARLRRYAALLGVAVPACRWVWVQGA